MKKLTIGIPVFNGEDTIAETLQSIVRDLPAEVEVLISDNDSSDNTCSIVKSFANKFSNIVLYKNDRNLDLLVSSCGC
jgi:glycosyltransferase involved in cell wall biosynthesis